jgi:hypothetical protein
MNSLPPHHHVARRTPYLIARLNHLLHYPSNPALHHQYFDFRVRVRVRDHAFQPLPPLPHSGYPQPYNLFFAFPFSCLQSTSAFLIDPQANVSIFNVNSMHIQVIKEMSAVAMSIAFRKAI